MPAYSLDLRTRVIAVYRQPSARQATVAARFRVSVSFLKKLLRHERQTGSLAPKPASGGRARYLDTAAQAWLVAYVGQHPDTTLAKLTQAWQAQGGRAIGQTCLWQVRPTAQKKATTRASVTRPAWWPNVKTLSKPWPSTAIPDAFTFSMKRASV